MRSLFPVFRDNDSRMSPFLKQTGSSAINPGMIRKYNQPTPRYTSYPTALKFCVIDDAESGKALFETQDDTGPVSLYFHLPYCQSLCWFCGCTKIISTNERLADTYLDYLEKEIDLILPTLGEGRGAIQLHFGGGTPNFLKPDQIERLTGMIKRNFHFEKHAELSVELDPRTLTREKVEAFRRLGINRASIGVQDVNPEVQKAIHRIQPSATNRKTMAWLKQAGIHQFNVDLVYGLPYQTPESFAATLDDVIGYDPDRFALFSYAHIPSKIPAQKIVERSPLPPADEKIAMLMLAMRKFKEAGYVHIGMDHFTKPDDPLALAQKAGTLQRNFQGYSLFDNTQICAFGMSAISQTQRTYRQNFKDIEKYYHAIDTGAYPVERGYMMNPDDQIRRHVIMRLMCDMELDFKALGEALDIDFTQYFAKELCGLFPLEEDGLIELSKDRLDVTALGRLLIRNIAVVFDAYTGKSNSDYSKAI